MTGAWFVLSRLARDRSALVGLVLIVALVVAALLAPVLATHPEDVFELHPAKRLRPPGADHWLGTDRMGSDIYSRLLFGARITLLIGVIAVGASLVIGVPVGLIAGYYHGWASDLLMRVSDIFLAVPQVVLAIAIAQTLGPSLPNVILALSVTYWPWFARLVYAETRALQQEVFIESTSALGASPFRLIVLHVLPNVAAPIIVQTSLSMAFAILTEAALSFLGLGVPEPYPSWGRMLSVSAAEYAQKAPYLVLFPGIAISLAVFGSNLLWSGLGYYSRARNLHAAAKILSAPGASLRRGEYPLKILLCSARQGRWGWARYRMGRCSLLEHASLRRILFWMILKDDGNQIPRHPGWFLRELTGDRSQNGLPRLFRPWILRGRTSGWYRPSFGRQSLH